ncbi:MAG: hypothetical protein HY804_06075 [Nitrospinae bacterium]|nr:hypothetical protein [Nitrospinota bacterium]
MTVTTFRRAFDRGLAPVFTLAATPLLMIPGLFLPAQFFPFLLAAALFPVFFYYIRSGRLGMALLNMTLWAAVILVCLGGLTALAPQWVALHVYGGAAPQRPSAPAPLKPTPADIGDQAWERARDAGIAAGLAAVSGGALPLVTEAVIVTGFAFNAGEAFIKGGVQAAALAIEPWTLTRLAALALITCGVAALFYMKIEHRPMLWRKSARWIVWGLFLLAVDVYLYFNLSHAWLTAYSRALTH